MTATKIMNLNCPCCGFNNPIREYGELGCYKYSCTKCRYQLVDKPIEEIIRIVNESIILY